ncbi:MAG: hypothetical protein JKY37_06175 [Nannocystaceae bacterium]|nr:hypothetical protein [Nannocystaceae bacterium]
MHVPHAAVGAASAQPDNLAGWDLLSRDRDEQNVLTHDADDTDLRIEGIEDTQLDLDEPAIDFKSPGCGFG